MILKYFFSTLFSFSNIFYCLAQNEHLTDNLAVIQGYAIDSSLDHDQDASVKIKIFVSKYPFGLRTIAYTKPLEYDLRCKKGDHFLLKIPLPASMSYIHFSVIFPGVLEHDRVGIDGLERLYILQKGDYVNCSFYKDHTTFTGKGSEKLNAFDEIYTKILQCFDDNTYIKLNNEERYKESISYVDSAAYHSSLLMNTVLKKYKHKVRENIYQMLKANVFMLRYEMLVGMIRTCIIFGEPAEKLKELFSHYKTFLLDRNFLMDSVSPQLLAQTPGYADFLWEKSYADVWVNAYFNRGTQDLHHFKPFYDRIKDIYSGILREELVTINFLEFKVSRSDAFAYLDESITLVHSPFYRQILQRIKATEAKGVPFYSFQLQDTSGRTFELKDFKDKLVIFDFWFSGCENCYILKHALEPVFDKFRGNPDIVFVSVCIDKTRQQWIKSIKSGEYTDPSELNLYTNGNAEKHPLIQHYDITAFPKQFVVLDGHMYDSSPPKAKYNWAAHEKPTLEGSTGLFVSVIEQGLKDLQATKTQKTN